MLYKANMTTKINAERTAAELRAYMQSKGWTCSLPALTEQNKADLKAALKYDFVFPAHSAPANS